MTADTKGITMRASTVKWVYLFLALLSPLAGGVSYVVSTTTARAEAKGRMDLFDLRLGNVEKAQQDAKELQMRTIDRIDNRLEKIEETLNQLTGQLRRQGRITDDPHASTTLAESLP